MLTCILGPAGSGKSRRIYSRIRDLLDLRRDMVLLTPEQQSHRAERELAAFCGSRLSLSGEVLSFTRMYNRVAIQTGGLADAVPDRGGRLLLMARTLELVGSSLRRYGGKLRRTDFLRQLLETVEELRSAMTEPEALLAAAEGAGSALGDKLRDLALLLGAYEGVLARNLGDSRDAVRRLADKVCDSTVGAGGVWLDGFTDFTEAELQVLDQLLRRGTDLTVALTLGREEGEQYRLTEHSFHRLAELAQRRGTELRVERLSSAPVTSSAGSENRSGDAVPARGPELADPGIAYLAEHLLDPSAPPLETEDCGVELCRMNTFPGECRWAAGRILELLREEPELRYRDFAIALPDFAGGRMNLESVLAEYGLPYFVEEAGDLGETGLVTFLLAALATVTGDWRYEDVFRCLKTGLAGLSPEETDELENYCLTWDIRGRAAWAAEAAWDMHPRGYEPELSEADRARLERVDGLRRKAARPLLKLGEVLNKGAEAGELLRALYRYFEEVELTRALAERAKRLAAAGETAPGRDLLRLWDVLMECLEQFDAVLGSTHLEGEHFARLLELLLQERDVGSIPAALDCVAIGGLSRMRGLKPRVLLILGADDASLPGSPGQSGIFSREERRQLYDLGLPLQHSRDEAVWRQLFDLYQTAAAPSRRLLVSCSGGEEVRPSILMTRARELLGAELQTEAALEFRHLTAAAEPCFRFALSGTGSRAEAARQCVDGRRLARLQRAVRPRQEQLSPETAGALYGASFRLTASRAETFHTCRRLYFLQYGLKARERRQAGFAAPELGTFVHYVLEHVCRDVSARGGFAGLPEETLLELGRRHTRAYTALYFRPSQLNDPRFRYLVERLCLAVESILKDVAGELASSDFSPLDFELRFARGGDLPPLQLGQVQLSGVVDRVDGWVDGDRLYLTVADYKTGRKQFSLSDVWYGQGIQMLVYLFMLAEEGRERYGREIVPAGVLYAPAREVLLSMPRSATEEEIGKKRRDALRRSGLLLADGRMLQAREHGQEPRYLPVKYVDGSPGGSIASAAQLGDLAAYVKRLLRKMGGRLAKGHIEARPLCKRPTELPCSWCPYVRACPFEAGSDEPELQRSMSQEEFWRKIREEDGDGEI